MHIISIIAELCTYLERKREEVETTFVNYFFREINRG